MLTPTRIIHIKSEVCRFLLPKVRLVGPRGKSRSELIKSAGIGFYQIPTRKFRNPPFRYSWHALGEFLDEGFIFLLTSGSNLRIFIDYRPTNSIERVSAAMNYLRMFNQSALGAPEIVAKGTEMPSAFGDSLGAELNG